jgi:hypothetical protein
MLDNSIPGCKKDAQLCQNTIHITTLKINQHLQKLVIYNLNRTKTNDLEEQYEFYLKEHKNKINHTVEIYVTTGQIIIPIMMQ